MGVSLEVGVQSETFYEPENGVFFKQGVKW
ncbi:hypothetical protein SAMN05216474_2425 [Lishizhenia tianjinensis]|uniref:Uncharacterized protein n=1 Tax=Lishizhenia tianjinensis TaxID=477690 RepID=A0A1I7AZW6_9FLAO|nr:hypothetical protein SAMN05216474_2425 [Lishizhenia tianjinensis]